MKNLISYESYNQTYMTDLITCIKKQYNNFDKQKTMKGECSTCPLQVQRGSLSQYDKSFRQNSSFFNNQHLYTPQHPHTQCNQMLLNTKQSLTSIGQYGCANKLCKNNIRTTFKQKSVLEISIDTLCTMCRKQFQNDSYCIYCKQVYFQQTDDGKQWIMCEECQRWVHSDCADFNTKQNPNAIFKCIKCKKIPNLTPGRRNIPRIGYAKIQKRKNNQFLNSIGFQWQLNTTETAYDMETIKQYLSSN